MKFKCGKEFVWILNRWPLEPDHCATSLRHTKLEWRSV